VVARTTAALCSLLPAFVHMPQTTNPSRRRIREHAALCNDRSARGLLVELTWWSGIGATVASVAYFVTAQYAAELTIGFSIEGQPPVAYWVEVAWPWPLAGALVGVLTCEVLWLVRSRGQRRQG
jgi:hypothetical protein